MESHPLFHLEFIPFVSRNGRSILKTIAIANRPRNLSRHGVVFNTSQIRDDAIEAWSRTKRLNKLDETRAKGSTLQLRNVRRVKTNGFTPGEFDALACTKGPPKARGE